MVKTCTQPGCNRQLVARHLCRRHYERLRYRALLKGTWPPEDDPFPRNEARTREMISQHLETLATRHRNAAKALIEAANYGRRLAVWLRTGA